MNSIAAAWLQFMIHDWFSHGKSPKENPWVVALAADDPWPEPPMQIMRTMPDPTRPAGRDGAADPHQRADALVGRLPGVRRERGATQLRPQPTSTAS